ncbi:hypothetical protein O6H91_01G117100 [Diphasiastrum complanatum]|uniref:Uncharacterized protein n=2 Tax=Diphasiastrum complanatum TaxID=34168 RepID=A0ACC2EV69_DIPCM|nr:hypothetical protein O6H91_01G117000 [Diphasiastrum complanatum]KAJ7570361.1 hypothetical protein O6H91_01G117100 [Diphasiastrum complanatum]
MFFQWLVVVTGIACILEVARVLRDLWWQPWQICKRLQAQGVKGPPFIPIVGNQPEVARLLAQATSTPMERSSHEIVPHVLPHQTKWSKLYGDMFVYTFGSKVRLTIADPGLIKKILSNKLDFPKVSPSVLIRDLFGDGLVLAEGEKWEQERRTLNPGFHVDKLKAMVETMSELTTNMLNGWARRIVEAKSPKGVKTVEIEVLEEYQNLTADVIAHTTFGTSYEAGKMVFSLQHRQQAMVVEAFYKSIRLPGQSYLPTPENLNRWKIRKTIEVNLRQIVEKRLQHNETQQNDLLDIMISAYRSQLLAGKPKNLRMSIQDIVDECKTFFFAGHETTASLLTWTTMLLALYPDWQERARAEVMDVCGRTRIISSDMLSQLKLVGLVLNESLRLYPGTSVLARCTQRDTRLGKLMIPKGTVLFIQLLVMMHNKELWGEDADDFSPERFSEGIAHAAKHPSAFIPFSIGPRNCIGQVFALMEAKVVLCKLLQRFSFQLSPTYVHAPTQFIVIKPKHGMQILFEPID